MEQVLRSLDEIEGSLRVYLHIAKRDDLESRAINEIAGLALLRKKDFVYEPIEEIVKLAIVHLTDQDLTEIYSSIKDNIDLAVIAMRTNIQRTRVRPRIEYEDVRFLVIRGLQSHFDYKSPFKENVAKATPSGHGYPLHVPIPIAPGSFGSGR